MRITDLALRLLGATSGEQIIKAAATASGAITLPAGTTDFSGAGPGVVKQASAGAAFTVAPVAVAEVTGAAPIASPSFTGNLTVAGSITAQSGVVASKGAGGAITFDETDNSANTWYWYSNASAARLLRTSLSDQLQISSSGTCANISGTWSAISAARLKKDIEPYRRGLEAMARLNPVTFRFNGQGGLADDGIIRYGLIAEDVADIAPEVVGEIDIGSGPDSKSMTVKTVDPGRLIYAVINSCKELAAMNAALSARIEALEARGASGG